MSLEPETIRRELEQALAALSGSMGAELDRRIQTVFLTSLERGRVQGATEGDPERIRAYVLHVANRFTILNEFIHAIQIERSPELWTPLFGRMQTWAYNFFLRKSFTATRETQELAAECATEAALNLLSAYFPYDTDFDPWAHIIVQNACRKRISLAFRKSTVPESQIVELEETLANTEEVLLELQTLQRESAAQLISALDQLSDARRAVIESLFFEELTAEETAEKLGKSVSAIYSLQFNALHDLRKIFGRIRDSLNE